jgi:hypothetical protein
VADVSKYHDKFPSANGEVILTPKDIVTEDDGVDIYLPDDDDQAVQAEFFEIDPNFQITVPTDASYAPDQMSRRSDLGTMVCLNGGPIDWSALRMNGIADSSFNAEYCAMSMGTKRTIPVSEMLRFMGIQHPPVVQYCDSTSATQVARNPHRLGAARSLGIRMHATRYAIAHEDLQLKYSITEDMVADILTKRMPRKKLARLSIVFFNNLQPDWHLDPDCLVPLRDVEWYPDLLSKEDRRIELLENDYDMDGWESEEEEDDDPNAGPENVDPNVVVVEPQIQPPGNPEALPISIEIHENRLRVHAQLLRRHRQRILENTRVIRATMENLLMPDVVTPYSVFDFQLWHDLFAFDWEEDEREFRRLDENTMPD